MNTLSILILLAAFLAIFHFIYDGILAPNLRMMQRNNLFKLRDEIRNIKIKGINHTDIEAFNFAHQGINNLIKNIPYMNIYTQIKLVKEKENNSAFAAEINKRVAILDECKNEQIKKIFTKSAKVVGHVMMINSGAWLLYIVTLVVPLVLLFIAFNVCYDSLKKMAKDLVAIPEKSFEKFAPHLV